MDKIILALFVAFLLSGCLTTSPSSGRVVVDGRHSSIDIVFSDRDRAFIHDYYKAQRKHKKHKKQKKVPPGLAKKGKLPPGLAKRDRLPPGLQGRGLPHELDRRLTHLPDDYVRVKVGADVVLMDRNTRVIFDIIYGID